MGTFFAVLPVDEAADDLRTFHRPVLDGVRWEPVERLHVTIRYFSSIEATTLGRVIDAGASVADSMAPPVVALGPATERLGRDGTLVVPARGVASIAVALDAALAAGGLDGVVEDRAEPFYGHLTLARLRRGARLPDEALGHELRASFLARSLVLIESTHTSEGRRYETISEAPFVGGGP